MWICFNFTSGRIDDGRNIKYIWQGAVWSKNGTVGKSEKKVYNSEESVGECCTKRPTCPSLPRSTTRPLSEPWMPRKNGIIFLYTHIHTLNFYIYSYPCQLYFGFGIAHKVSLSYCSRYTIRRILFCTIHPRLNFNFFFFTYPKRSGYADERSSNLVFSIAGTKAKEILNKIYVYGYFKYRCFSFFFFLKNKKNFLFTAIVFYNTLTVSSKPFLLFFYCHSRCLSKKINKKQPFTFSLPS